MKKTSILVLIIFILLIAIGFMIYNEFANANSFQVGDTQFVLPEGYHVGILNRNGDVNITNGTNSLFFAEHNGTDINHYVQGYSEYKLKNNRTITIENFTIDGKFVCKATNSNNNTARYFFINNNKVYSIYNWDYNNKLDETVSELIKTAN